MRIPNWDYELVVFANERIGTTFKFGSNDCVAIVREAWNLITGSDVFGDEIPNYTTSTGAVRAFKKIGSFEDVLKKVGAKEIPLNRATYGDIVFQKSEYENGPFQNVALVVGRNALIASQDHNQIVTSKLLSWRQSLDDTYTAYRAP